jgi:hypothetical protein
VKAKGIVSAASPKPSKMLKNDTLMLVNLMMMKLDKEKDFASVTQMEKELTNKDNYFCAT